MNDSKRPPAWVQSLLKRFADEQTLEEVEGDMLEFYPEWISQLGHMRATWKYFFTVITLLRPLKKKRRELSNTIMLIMIRSYFTVSWRTILKNRVSSIINIAGLTLGLTTSLLILLVVMREFEYDQQHVKKDLIFFMMKNQKTNDGISTGRATMAPLAEALRSDFPQVVRSARVSFSPGTRVLVGNQKSNESGVYVDADIFRIMTLPSLHGDPVQAIERNSIVVSESMATKLFGNKDVVGKTMMFGSIAVNIGAVIKDIPQTNTLKFQIALPFILLERNSEWVKKWDDNRLYTWVELSSPDATALNESIANLVTQHTNDPNESVFAYPFSKIHLYGGFSNGQPSGGLITIIWILIGFGVFMLLIACVNFMNIATAQSTRRAREVGVRKVLGAMRRWIVFQFLNESLVVTFISLFFAVVLAILVIPSFNTMMHTSISFDFGKSIVWILCLSVALITALIAGSYPAFVLSRFTPVRVLKGMIDRPGGLSIRRILVTFQFVISISVLIGTIILDAQFDHVKSRPMGYEQDNLVRLPLDSLGGAKFNIIKNEVSKIQGVKSVTGINGNILYSSAAISGMDWTGKKAGEDLSVVVADVEYNWTETMGIEIVSGRDFSSRFKSDESACLLNEAAVDRMALQNPVGSVVGGHTVIGVFRDFVYNNPSGVISPMAVFLRPSNVRNLYVRIENNDSWMATMTAIQTAVKQVSPEMDFDFRFTSDEHQANFEELSDLGLMVSIFGGMTIFISCLGLFGLSGFIAERRGKEMSIRKVFGANSLRVLLSLSSDILKPVAFALLIVIPFSVWIAGMALQEFVYHVSLTWWMFAQATAMVLLIALMVVAYHGWRTAIESPSVRLKSE